MIITDEMVYRALAAYKIVIDIGQGSGRVDAMREALRVALEGHEPHDVSAAAVWDASVALERAAFEGLVRLAEKSTKEGA